MPVPKHKPSNLARRALVLTLLTSVSAGVNSVGAQTASLTPTYSFQFFDAVTGPNCTGMTKIGGCQGTGWFVTPGADVYADDVYERPTSQTYTGPTPVASEYLGYLDLVSARYGYNDQFMFFQLNMYSPYLYKNDGTVDMGVFGSGTYYGVQLGSNTEDDGQLLLRAEQEKGTLGTSTSLYSALKTQGWYDFNNSISGPGGVGTPNEEGIIPDFNGYELGVIETDGYLAGGGDKSYVLFSRSYVDVDGQAVVELAFDYFAYNAYCAANALQCALMPDVLPYLVFETTRGLKDNQNYLWNDKYSSSEAGTPYTTAGLGNIYELDNMRVGELPDPLVVPEPASFLLLSSGVLGLALAARKKRLG